VLQCVYPGEGVFDRLIDMAMVGFPYTSLLLPIIN